MQNSQNKESPKIDLPPVTRYQDRVPYNTMKGISSCSRPCKPAIRAPKTFDPANAVDSSFIHELKKTGFIDAAWKSKRVSCCRDKISNP
jgi:hypothetical protein